MNRYRDDHAEGASMQKYSEQNLKKDQDRRLRWSQVRLRAVRTKRGYSQESVCHGICAPSYLSKIENGAVLASMEVLELLAARLKTVLAMPDEDDLHIEQAVFALLRRGKEMQARSIYEAAMDIQSIPPADQRRPDEAASVFSHGWRQSISGILLEGLFASKPVLPNGQHLHFPEYEKKGPGKDPDSELSSDLKSRTVQPDRSFDLEWLKNHLPEAFPCMNSEQKSLAFLLLDQPENAWDLCPFPWIAPYVISAMYRLRKDESKILQLADAAYQKASDQGEVLLMAQISAFQGALYSNMDQYELSRKCNSRAENIYRMIGEWDLLDDILYNEGCTRLSMGQFEQALEDLQSVKNPSFMVFHKMAVCYEQLKMKEEAAICLARAEGVSCMDWPEELARQILDVVWIRLKNPNYHHDPVYGKTLIALFENLRNANLHFGYAQFHLPWLVSWYKANRQYARLVQLLEEFPGKRLFQVI